MPALWAFKLCIVADLYNDTHLEATVTLALLKVSDWKSGFKGLQSTLRSTDYFFYDQGDDEETQNIAKQNSSLTKELQQSH